MKANSIDAKKLKDGDYIVFINEEYRKNHIFLPKAEIIKIKDKVLKVFYNVDVLFRSKAERALLPVHNSVVTRCFRHATPEEIKATSKKFKIQMEKYHQRELEKLI